MAVFAHPDDEALGLGGVLARYAAEGVEIALLTATRGDRGRWRGQRAGEGDHPGAEALGVLREDELRAAARVLGIRDVRVLGYGDQALDQADPGEIVPRIASAIRAFRPHVVVTFGPDGIYGHPDHIAISQFATGAVLAAASSAPGLEGAPHVVAKLYYMVWGAEAWATYQRVVKRLISVVDGVEREATPWPDWAVTTVVETGEHWKVMREAIECHDSQRASFEPLLALPAEQHDAIWGRLTLYRAMSLVNGGRRRETDLFEGLRD